MRFHVSVLKEMRSLDAMFKMKIADFMALLASGESLSMPVSRPMPSVAVGAHELRIKDPTGQYRIFYFTKHKEAILVFHMFKKKTEATPKRDLEVAQKRLEEMR